MTFSRPNNIATFAEISLQFANLSRWLDGNVPDNDERTQAQRRLAESRNAAINARFRDPPRHVIVALEDDMTKSVKVR